MKRVPQRRYSKEFRQEAVKLLLDHGLKVERLLYDRDAVETSFRLQVQDFKHIQIARCYAVVLIFPKSLSKNTRMMFR